MTEGFPQVDLTNCDREPIHQLGAIQPFGFLLALSSDFMVARASANLETFLGIKPQDAIGRPLNQIFPADAVHLIRNRLTLLRGADSLERAFGLSLTGDGRLFDVALHMSHGSVIIEGEISQPDDHTGSTHSLRSMMSRLDQAETIERFYREGARQARALTGFDRVMVYRFDEQGSGEVVAEAARPGIGSFLGLHYPASDIPVQARALYLRNLFRIIADIGADPVPIIPALDEAGRPLDLSMSILRSVSPIHIEYLKNMGVGASLSISIVVDGKLWGLFACHHYGPRLPSFERRSTAELFGQMFASRLESRERRQALEFETNARRIADQLLTSVVDNTSLLEDPAWLVDSLFKVIPCDGIGVFINGQVSLAGLAPDDAAFRDILKRLNRNAAGRIYATDSLSEFMEGNISPGAAAGFLSIPISRSPRDYVVLFRQEIIRSVRWAGDPHKPVEYGPNGPRLTPRKSFEAWSELVQNRSLPFTPAEKRVAETIRVTLIEVVLRLANDASEIRRQANERQELLIAELNHRVRNILSLISGLVRRSRSPGMTVSDYANQIEGRIQSLARAHEQITRDNWSAAALRGLLETEADAYLGKAAARIVLSGDEVLLNPQAFSTAALVFHELVTNSAKYGSLSDSGAVDVTWRRDEDGALHIKWAESGGPPVKEPERQGFGTTIIRRSIPFDLQGDADVRFEPDGLQAMFRIPAPHVIFPDAQTARDIGAQRAAARVAGSSGDRILAGRSVLLVEDNLIIAMDGEDILSRLGADYVTTAGSVAEALDAIARQRFDLAVLDVNLGSETSFPVAEKLAGEGIAFAFATGYGDTLERSGPLELAPVIAKPYTIESLAGGLSVMLSQE